MSTVNDPSGAVLVDVLPPGPAPSPAGGTPRPVAGASQAEVPDLGRGSPRELAAEPLALLARWGPVLDLVFAQSGRNDLGVLMADDRGGRLVAWDCQPRGTAATNLFDPA
jgi:hypothetical protein